MNVSKSVRIPNTDIALYPVGFGTVSAGLDWDGKEAFALLDAFVDMGGNLIDTARIYSDWVKPEIGRSERVLGDWIRRRGHHNDIVLVTKGGHPDLNHMHTSRMTKKDMDHDLSLSMKALGVDCIDIYIYHRDDTAQPVADLLGVMEDYVKEGKIRYYGCSNWTSARMKEAHSYAKAHSLRGFVANQMLFNMGLKYMNPFPDDTMVSMDADMMEIHRTTDILAMPYFGVCSGFFHILAAKGEQAVKASSYYTQGNLSVMKKILSICEKYNVTITQVLLGFFYAQDFPVVPLASSANIDQLREIMAAPACNIKPGEYVF
ncbi:MAG: General stress protein 69 [Firmicutes bacterium ADurb.Bin182]|nr:MAG: General stress protein 69 [Firmicutes bacterium ADurb.Bin182]